MAKKDDTNKPAAELDHSKEFEELDKLIFEINKIITKVSADHIKYDIKKYGQHDITHGDIVSNYNSGIVSFIHRFITVSQKCQEWYVDECNEEFSRLRKLS